MAFVVCSLYVSYISMFFFVGFFSCLFFQFEFITNDNSIAVLLIYNNIYYKPTIRGVQDECNVCVCGCGDAFNSCAFNEFNMGAWLRLDDCLRVFFAATLFNSFQTQTIKNLFIQIIKIKKIKWNKWTPKNSKMSINLSKMK